MNSRDVRSKFLEFFAERGHQVVPSSPLILPSDPTLLFANAGMNQFKDVFRGRESRPYTRAASSQKCLRVSGKHNDLEEVGRTPRHHTFFEMLGNFSFGDYFKEDAIAWAWQLMTEVYGLPGDRLYPTVFRGDDDFEADDEAAELWTRIAGVPPERVTRLGRKDNFWQMGETGPAGPCSEILYDLDPEGDPNATPETDSERFFELWNLVFMQHDLQPDGSVRPLPAPCVDTGAGLERITAVLQGVATNYDTDIFRDVIDPIAADAGVTYGASPKSDVSLRVIADHLRAITALVTEGVIPGPAKRGAVLRRILRRALRHGRLLGLEPPFLVRHVPHVVDALGEAHPEIADAQEIVVKVVGREEERFEKTLADGFEKLEERIDALLEGGGGKLSGDEAFVLESERGLPLDLVEDALSERGLELDRPGYNAARLAHVEASRVVKEKGDEGHDVETFRPHAAGGSEFVGYGSLHVDATRVLALFQDGQEVDTLSEGAMGHAILETTPFYAESGGQTADRGRLVTANGTAAVADVQKPIAGVILHTVHVEHGTLSKGDLAVADVDEGHREGARRHHTATHLLHAALRQVLGTHVRQAGSLVMPDRLRFDFSHYDAIDAAALADIEDLVNDTVLEDEEVATAEMPLDEALASGAVAFFGDRYGETVRVVRIGEFSMELCGGTHVGRTGEIGPIVVGSERGVAAGVRRVEALAGDASLRQSRAEREAVAKLARVFGVPRDELVEGAVKRLDAMKKLQKENEELRMRLAREQGGEGERVSEAAGIRIVAREVEGLDRSQRRDLADGMRQKNPGGVVVLGARDGDKAALLVAIGAELKGKVDARAVIKSIAPIVGGGGGGREDLAEAGGKLPDKISEALAAAPDAVASLAGS